MLKQTAFATYFKALAFQINFANNFRAIDNDHFRIFHDYGLSLKQIKMIDKLSNSKNSAQKIPRNAAQLRKF